ncbi:MAG TPA: winged helix-turn-helix domain-containing protein [Rhizomicrobium sp.]|jgi:DNA-binding winged helix-turn-helix (wHTH) protein
MSPARPFTLGGWQVDPARGTITATDDGTTTRLEPRLVELLQFFAAEPGTVLTKDRIIAAVWGGRAVGDDTLAAAISRLRGALRRGARDYIETLPKRGYRLREFPDSPPALRTETARPDDNVTRGFAALKNPLASSSAQARLYFDAALAADPRNALAHAGLAQTGLQALFAGAQSASALRAAARASALAALALDNHLPLPHAVLGFVTLLEQRDFAAADAHFLRALDCDATFVAALRYRSFALAAVGRFVEAERGLRRVIEGDTQAMAARADLLQVLMLARRFRPAIAEAKALLALAPHAAEAWAARGWAHHFLGEDTDARDALIESLKLWGTPDEVARGLGNDFAAACAHIADLFEAQHLVFTPRPTDIAILRLTAGDIDRAFALLEQAAAREDPFLLWLPHMPWFARLHNDPRWQALIGRIRPAH